MHKQGWIFEHKVNKQTSRLTHLFIITNLVNRDIVALGVGQNLYN
jgi:hypothetical protein